MALPVTSAPTTVLVVEDQPLVLRLVTLSLTRAGFTVLSAAGAEEARRVEGRFAGAIHLLLSDVIMLHSSGLELAEELKARRPEMRVILMSGRPDDIRIHHYQGHFLQKPFLPCDLLAMVKRVLPGEVHGVSDLTKMSGAGQ
jgi:two-component system, cell cycle sensor histidine kinase and response regulator CckA